MSQPFPFDQNNTYEGSNPITEPVTKHRVSVLTARDEEVLSLIFKHRRKTEMNDRSSMSRTSEGNNACGHSSRSCREREKRIDSKE